jgi:hypothetical protein
MVQASANGAHASSAECAAKIKRRRQNHLAELQPSLAIVAGGIFAVGNRARFARPRRRTTENHQNAPPFGRTKKFSAGLSES